MHVVNISRYENSEGAVVYFAGQQTPIGHNTKKVAGTKKAGQTDVTSQKKRRKKREKEPLRIV